MKQIYQYMALLCMFFTSVVYSCTDSAVDSQQEDTASNDTTDVRWRVISGLDASAIYSHYVVSLVSFSHGYIQNYCLDIITINCVYIIASILCYCSA